MFGFNNPALTGNGPSGSFNPALHPALAAVNNDLNLTNGSSTSSPPTNSTSNILTPIQPNGTTPLNSITPNVLTTLNGLNPIDWPINKQPAEIGALQAAAAAVAAKLSWRQGNNFEYSLIYSLTI